MIQKIKNGYSSLFEKGAIETSDGRTWEIDRVLSLTASSNTSRFFFFVFFFVAS